MEQSSEFLEQQLKRVITQLFKNFLIILEDVQQDHLQVINDMKNQFPENILQQWNYLSFPKYSRIRKKVLDSGNDALREMKSILDNLQKFTDNKESA